MKKYIFTLLLGFLVFSCTSVAKTSPSYKVDPVCCSVDGDLVSTIISADISVDAIAYHAILPATQRVKDRQAEKVDYFILRLPNHDLLPNSNIWLINCAIRQC